MVTQSPNRLDDVAPRSARETEILQTALDRRCSLCGAKAGVWCFKVGGVWTLHAQRIMDKS